MSTFSKILKSAGVATANDTAWLHLLLGDVQLMADLAFADTVLWVPNKDRSFVALAHARPSSAPTLFYRDFVGKPIKAEWRAQVNEAYETGLIVESMAPEWFEETPTRVRAVPIVRRPKPGAEETLPGPIAVLTLHTNLSENRSPSRQELTFNACANDLFEMMTTGDFPDVDAAPAPRRGAPRASDGLIRLDADGYSTFASPNALSAFNRIGYADELEGELLGDVVNRVIAGRQTVDESLPLVASGRVPWRADVQARGVTISLRAIPVRRHGGHTGAIVLTRDVTELRHQERELITKDATIREIHHRVKNNLQTVASLLRVQARRTHSEEARDALTQAMRRVASIAVVHDTLSEGLAQNVDFDDVFQRVLALSAEVAAILDTQVSTSVTGSFGTLPSDYATPLALALTEVVTNAVEHGLAGRGGNVEISAVRSEEFLTVHVRDNGAGMIDGLPGDGLGTQIVRTLIEGELSGTIAWANRPEGGVEVTIEIPMRFIAEALGESSDDDEDDDAENPPL